MSRWHFLPLLAALMLGLSQCSTLEPGEPIGELSKVTRSQCLATAARYANHRWTAEPRHAYHGVDLTGVRVDTPDHAFAAEERTPGWWKPGPGNVGVPYCWGGFDTPESFDAHLKTGKFAGDVYTSQKRAGLNDAVSQFTTGVDCSGFVSRCWNLDWHCSTRTIPKICNPLLSYDALKPGDALSTYNGHILLFEKFTRADKSEFLVYETGSPLGWKVIRHTTTAEFLQGQGYKAYRYRGMKER
jgi:hypothetical protein